MKDIDASSDPSSRCSMTSSLNASSKEGYDDGRERYEDLPLQLGTVEMIYSATIVRSDTIIHE